MKNITNKQLISYFPKLVNSGRDNPLTDEELEQLKISFYEYAQAYGFHKSITKCAKLIKEGKTAKYLFKPQQELIDTLLSAIFQKKQYRIYLSLPRQVGKTEIVTLVSSYCYDVYFTIFKKPFLLAIVTPNSQTSSAIFSRLVQKMSNMKVPLDIDKNIVKQTVRGDRIELFSIFSDKRSATTEGRTFNLIIRDEAHEGDDNKFEDELLPSLNSTNGTFVMIGNGCHRDCMFWQGITKGDGEELLVSVELKDGNRFDKYAYNKVIRYPYTTKIKPYFEKLGHEGLPHFLNIVASIELEKNRTSEGAERPYFKKNYECELINKSSGYVTRDEVLKCLAPTQMKADEDVYIGIDVAIKNDRTIALVMTQSAQIIDIIILKDSYAEMSVTEQMESFIFTLSRKDYINNVKGIGLDFNGGYGDAARTILERSFNVFIHNYKFYRQKKHVIYANLKQALTTINKAERIKIDATKQHTELLVEELTQLVVKYDKNGYGEYNAPRSYNAFDDIVCALAIANDIRNNYNLLVDEDRGEKIGTNTSGFLRFQI